MLPAEPRSTESAKILAKGKAEPRSTESAKILAKGKKYFAASRSGFLGGEVNLAKADVAAGHFKKIFTLQSSTKEQMAEAEKYIRKIYRHHSAETVNRIIAEAKSPHNVMLERSPELLMPTRSLDKAQALANEVNKQEEQELKAAADHLKEQELKAAADHLKEQIDREDREDRERRALMEKWEVDSFSVAKEREAAMEAAIQSRRPLRMRPHLLVAKNLQRPDKEA